MGPPIELPDALFRADYWWRAEDEVSRMHQDPARIHFSSAGDLAIVGAEIVDAKGPEPTWAGQLGDSIRQADSGASLGVGEPSGFESLWDVSARARISLAGAFLANPRLLAFAADGRHVAVRDSYTGALEISEPSTEDETE